MRNYFVYVSLVAVGFAGACRSEDNPVLDFSGEDFSVGDFAKPDLTGIDLAGDQGDMAGDMGDMFNADMYKPLFANAVSYGVELGPKYLAAADLNKDGKRDLVVVNVNAPNAGVPVPSSVNILLGNGDGTFQTKTSTNIDKFPYGVAIGDVNGDTNADLVISVFDGYDIMTGNGNGTFNAPVKFTVAGAIRTVAIGDIDGDGKIDVVLSDIGVVTGKVWVALGNGSGSFGTATSFEVSLMGGVDARSPAVVRLGDMNNDGKLDVVTANTTDSPTVNSVSILLNASTVGTAVLSATPLEISVGKRPQDLLVGQLDASNKLDFVVANASDNSVSVFLSDSTSMGSVTFNAAATYTSVGSAPVALVFADIDADTKQDIVMANSGGGNITVLYGNGGLFNQATANRPGSESYSVGANPISIVAGTFNADVKVDIAVVNQQSNNVSVLLNQR